MTLLLKTVMDGIHLWILSGLTFGESSAGRRLNIHVERHGGCGGGPGAGLCGGPTGGGDGPGPGIGASGAGGKEPGGGCGPAGGMTGMSSSLSESGMTNSTSLVGAGGCSGTNMGCFGGMFRVLRGKTDFSKTTSVLVTVECDNGFHSLYPFVELS